MYRKYDSTRIKTEEEAFSSKRCLEWFYEYAGRSSLVTSETESSKNKECLGGDDSIKK